MDPDPRKEIEVDPDPDLDPERGLKWIRIRPNAADPGGSGSETLKKTHNFSLYPPDILSLSEGEGGDGYSSTPPGGTGGVKIF